MHAHAGARAHTHTHLVDIEVDNDAPPHGAFPHECGGDDGEIIEDGEPTPMCTECVVRAPPCVACQPLLQRSPRRQQRPRHLFQRKMRQGL